MLGTGVFVAVGLAAGVTGPAVVLAVVLAAAVAACNALSAAQLAASHPVSGGTYEFAHRYLNAPLGFAAGWLFWCAKTASAAAAALSFAAYALPLLGLRDPRLALPAALAAVVGLTILARCGLRRSNLANAVLVAVTVGSLLWLVGACLPVALAAGGVRWHPFVDPLAGGSAPHALLQATALLFVAFTGYGRVATLGEEIRDPRQSIPRAIGWTILVVTLIYAAVAAVAVGAVGAGEFYGATRDLGAPLAVIARRCGVPWGAAVLTVGACTAMLGVILNLVHGLSRVVLAMARRGDLPPRLATLNPAGTTPVAAVWLVGTIVAGLVLVGDLKTTWSFSAFTVLIYYALTNLAALRLPPAERCFPPWVAGCGLVACLGLAVTLEARVVVAGLGLLAAGFVARALWPLMARSTATPTADDAPPAPPPSRHRRRPSA